MLENKISHYEPLIYVCQLFTGKQWEDRERYEDEILSRDWLYQQYKEGVIARVIQISFMMLREEV